MKGVTTVQNPNSGNILNPSYLEQNEHNNHILNISFFLLWNCIIDIKVLVCIQEVQ